MLRVRILYTHDVSDYYSERCLFFEDWTLELYKSAAKTSCWTYRVFLILLLYCNVQRVGAQSLANREGGESGVTPQMYMEDLAFRICHVVEYNRMICGSK